ncbi:hypothetical protein BB561_000045 [Smittium simulii]|uniref:tRNA N(3)-methylcytidine methyltransferase n=1 Tax=Smittium simulii TaxID=133385 RepID=A0A2T9Z0R4_9FUNG|nr:hypothetical protein BB561_000045 [Smittium simulii]
MSLDFDQHKTSALAILEADKSELPDFWKNKYSTELAKNWDKFYKRNTTNFFKDRHWTDREFAELIQDSESQKSLLEIGCGVGNFIWPLLVKNPSLYIYACDFSVRAVDFVKANENYHDSRCKAFVCDIVKDDLLDNIPCNSVDMVSSIFVFSAILPEKMKIAVANIKKILKPGGIILFRDYGLYDAAQLRFKKGSKFSENLYVRQDGTLSYFLSKEFVHQLFVIDGGFEEIENDYVIKKTTNIKRNLNVDRVFLQAKFILPK